MQPIHFRLPTGYWLCQPEAYGLPHGVMFGLLGKEQDCPATPENPILTGEERLFLRLDWNGTEYDRLAFLGVGKGKTGRRFSPEIVLSFKANDLAFRSEVALDYRFKNSDRQWGLLVSSVLAQTYARTANDCRRKKKGKSLQRIEFNELPTALSRPA